MIKNFKKILFAITLILSMAPFVASAADPAEEVNESIENILNTEKNDNDDFHSILEHMWGSFIFDQDESVNDTIEPTLLSKTVGYTNVLALILGIIITSYVTLASVINTAQSGEVLGKQWSSYWLPIRTSMAFGLLIPTKIGALTLSTAQVIVIKLIIMSSTSATFLWSNTVDYLIPPSDSNPQVVLPYSIGYSTYTSALCLYAKAMEDSGIFGFAEQEMTLFTTSGLDESVRTEYLSHQVIEDINLSSVEQIDSAMQDANSSNNTFISSIEFSDGECGTVSFKHPKLITSSKINDSESSLTDFDSVVSNRVLNNYRAYQRHYSDFLAGVLTDLSILYENDDLRKALSEYKSTQLADDAEKMPVKLISTVSNMTLQFRKRMDTFSSKVNGIYLESDTGSSLDDGVVTRKKNSPKELSEAIKEGGWLYAGNFFFRMSQLEGVSLKTSGDVVSVKNNTPTCTADDCDVTYPLAAMYIAGIVYRNSYIKPDKEFSSISDIYELTNDSSISPDASVVITSSKGNNNISEGLITGFISSKILNLIAEEGEFWGFDDNLLQQESNGDSTIDYVSRDNPFQYAVYLGNGLNSLRVGLQLLRAELTIAQAILGGMGETLLGSFGASVGTSVAEAIIGLILELLVISILSLTAMGWILAYYLPMMPALLWVTLITAYLLISIEAVIATPLAVILMATPEGEGISGTKMQRAITLLASVFLRPSLMVIGLIVAVVVAKYSFMLLNKIYWTQAKYAVGEGLFATFAVLAIYISALHQILSNSIMAMDTVPTTVLDWIGSNGGGGQFGQAEVRSLENTVTKTEGMLGNIGDDFAKKIGQVSKDSKDK
jgi:conjugal transfer/type IV secretion protein DotA/TraY